jgi:hypothetical protein
MDQHTDCVIDTRGLSKAYKGVNALQPLDLQVQKNTMCS